MVGIVPVDLAPPQMAISLGLGYRLFPPEFALGNGVGFDSPCRVLVYIFRSQHIMLTR